MDPLHLTGGMIIPAKAMAFDMDGTLIDSTDIIEDLWRGWASRHGIDIDPLLALAHGQRGIDTIRMWAPPGLDHEHELRLLLDEAAANLDGLRPVPGAVELLHSLPADRWAIVTSSDLDLARRWLGHLDFPMPEVFITAAHVPNGKPAPDGYRLAADRLNVAPQDMLVFEDAHNGFLAGESAGSQVIALATRLSGDALANRPWIADYARVRYADGALHFG